MHVTGRQQQQRGSSLCQGCAVCGLNALRGGKAGPAPSPPRVVPGQLLAAAVLALIELVQGVRVATALQRRQQGGAGRQADSITRGSQLQAVHSDRLLRHIARFLLLAAENKTRLIDLCWAVTSMATDYLPLPWAGACPLGAKL